MAKYAVLTTELIACTSAGLYSKANLLSLDLTSYEQSVVVHGTEVLDTGVSHIVWLLTMKDRSSFIIDLAGAQFGHRDVVLPSSRYDSLHGPHYQHLIAIENVRDEYACQPSEVFGNALFGDLETTTARRDLLVGKIVDDTASTCD